VFDVERPPRLRAGVLRASFLAPAQGGGHHRWSRELGHCPWGTDVLLLYEDKPPHGVVIDLMTRGLKRETD
jgi:hypothetical protein